MSVKWVVFGEAPADQRIAADLADRIVFESVDWIESGTLQWQRTWIGAAALSDGNLSLLWLNLPRIAKELRIRPQGFFDGQPGAEDARQARIAIAVARRICSDVSAVLLIRDSDKRAKWRKAGLQQASASTTGLPVLIGLAVPEREAWVIAGFDPADRTETVRLENERQLLGFDPRTDSDRLMATSDDTAKKSAKRVLKSLSGDSREREATCWQSTALETLKSRGGNNGLKAFIDDVTTTLVPLVSGREFFDSDNSRKV